MTYKKRTEELSVTRKRINVTTHKVRSVTWELTCEEPATELTYPNKQEVQSVLLLCPFL